MGAAASASPSQSPIDLFAFLVAKQEFERLSQASSRQEAPLVLSDANLHDRLAFVYNQAKLEYETPVEECRLPAVILFKYKALNQDEKKAFDDNIVMAITEKENLRRIKIEKEKAIDYSQTFGGTADDSKNEREAAALLRGNDGNSEDDILILRKPETKAYEDAESLRSTGKWKKFMGAHCFMFIHTLTRDIEGIRPYDYEDEVDDSAGGNEAESVRDPANGLPSVLLADLPAEIERIVTVDKMTPLILDPLDIGARAFYSYKARLEVDFFMS